MNETWEGQGSEDNKMAPKWGFPKIRGCCMGAPMVRIIVTVHLVPSWAPLLAETPKRRQVPFSSN